jgi:glycosyl transferase family 87
VIICGTEQESWPLNKRKLIRLLVGGLLTAAVVYLVATHMDKVRANVSQRDSIQYWAAGKLLIHRQNPYDVQKTVELEWNEGYTQTRPVLVRTPPWSLFLFLPLGLANAFWGWVLWIAASVAALIVAMRLSWKMFGKDDKLRPVFLMVGYLFAPVLACLEAAQIGFVLLIGIVLFLEWEEKRPFLAGAALLLPFAKPHLLVFFWLAFLLWILSSKKFAVAGGFITAVAAATILALVFDPAAFQHYREFLRIAAIEGEFIPTVSGVVRLLFFRPHFRAQFVPTLLGLVWSLWFCWKNRAKWSWRDHGLTVMVVSILTTPYGWLTDEVVLLPAVLFAAMCIFGGKEKLRVTARMALAVFGLLNWLMLLLIASHIPLQTGIYFWSSLLWCGWYFYGRGWQVANRLEQAAG